MRMTQSEIKKLHTILAKIENLQLHCRDEEAKERMQSAKGELLRLLSRVDP